MERVGNKISTLLFAMYNSNVIVRLLTKSPSGPFFETPSR
jgi:hypothetical protein